MDNQPSVQVGSTRIRPTLNSNHKRPLPPIPVSIIDVCEDPMLFGPWFKDKQTWASWFTLLKAIFNIPMTSQELAIYRECTGRNSPPKERVTDLTLIVGRRGGKSSIVSLLGVFLATMVDWSSYLSPGERGTIMIMAADRKQSRTIFRYIEAYLTRCQLLEPLVGRDTMEIFELKNQINIEIMTANARTIRGYSVVAALCDEIAFWSTEDSVNPDDEILAALRPSMATIPGAMMMLLSSPYAQRGALYKQFQKYYGKELDDTLVWKAPTWVMNPSLPRDGDFITKEYEKDAAKAEAEYGANFRADVQILIPPHIIEENTETGVYERPYDANHSYVAFVDPSGGSQDSMTLGIAHAEENIRVLDVVREIKPPFSPEEVVKEFAALLRMYHISTVTGDRYGGEWVVEMFDKHGIDYLLSDLNKSEIFLVGLALLNSRRARLLDNEVIKNQLIGLERKTTRGGRDTVVHQPGGRDDLGNAAIGALALMDTYDPVDTW